MERPVYHPYSLGTLAPLSLSEHQQSLDTSYSYSPASSSLIKNSPSLPPCQPYKTAFSSSLTGLGDYSSGSSVTTSLAPAYQPQYQHNLAFTEQASLASANSLLANTNTISDFQDPSTIIKTENDNCNNLDEEEDTTEEEEKSDKEDCKEGNNKPPYSYVAMIGESDWRN